jgi:hypothetical protein
MEFGGTDIHLPSGGQESVFPLLGRCINWGSRDNPTVSRRVLQLADSLGRNLEKQSVSLEGALKGGVGDVFTTKKVKELPASRQARL